MLKCPSRTVCGGRTGTTMAEQTEKEKKTNIGNMATDRTLLLLELSCPAGTSGTAVTPGGHQMEPDSTTAVYKSRQAGRRWLEKHLR